MQGPFLFDFDRKVSILILHKKSLFVEFRITTVNAHVERIFSFD